MSRATPEVIPGETPKRITSETPQGGTHSGITSGARTIPGCVGIPSETAGLIPYETSEFSFF